MCERALAPYHHTIQAAQEHDLEATMLSIPRIATDAHERVEESTLSRTTTPSQRACCQLLDLSDSGGSAREPPTDLPTQRGMWGAVHAWHVRGSRPTSAAPHDAIKQQPDGLNWEVEPDGAIGLSDYYGLESARSRLIDWSIGHFFWLAGW